MVAGPPRAEDSDHTSVTGGRTGLPFTEKASVGGEWYGSGSVRCSITLESDERWPSRSTATSASHSVVSGLNGPRVAVSVPPALVVAETSALNGAAAKRESVKGALDTPIS